jgi:hypothetical protein
MWTRLVEKQILPGCMAGSGYLAIPLSKGVEEEVRTSFL